MKTKELEVHYISDLHIDFFIKEKNRSLKLEQQLKSFIEFIGLTAGDVLIIGGDLGHYYVQDSLFLKLVKKLYKHVLIVPGNHDRYLVSNNLKHKYKLDSMNRITEMKEFCASNNINYLDGDTVEIEGVKFSGVGMSWDKSFAENLNNRTYSDEEITRLFTRNMNDSRLMYSGKEHVSISGPYGSETFISNFDPFAFFKSEQQKMKKIKEADVMITHYGPCYPNDLNPEYANSEVSTFFYYDGSDDLARLKPKYWVYGHTHTSAEYKRNATTMLCNPLGYPGENPYAQVKRFNIGANNASNI